MFAVLGVDDDGDVGAAGGGAGVEEGADLMGVDDVGVFGFEEGGDFFDGGEVDAGGFLDAGDGGAEGFGVGGHFAGAFEAEDVDAFAVLDGLPREAEDDAFESADVEGEDDVGDV
jgi:hypothetical protein